VELTSEDASTPAPSTDGRTPKATGARLEELSLCAIVCSLLMVASLVMVFWNLQDASLDNAYTASRYATIESLVD